MRAKISTFAPQDLQSGIGVCSFQLISYFPTVDTMPRQALSSSYYPALTLVSIRLNRHPMLTLPSRQLTLPIVQKMAKDSSRVPLQQPQCQFTRSPRIEINHRLTVPAGLKKCIPPFTEGVNEVSDCPFGMHVTASDDGRKGYVRPIATCMDLLPLRSIVSPSAPSISSRGLRLTAPRYTPPHRRN